MLADRLSRLSAKTIAFSETFASELSRLESKINEPKMADQSELTEVLNAQIEATQEKAPRESMFSV